MAVGVQYSLTNIQFGASSAPWVGLANYQRMLNDHTFWLAVQVTIEYSLAVIVAAFFFSWNEFLFASTMISIDSGLLPGSVGLTTLIGLYSAPIQTLLAGGPDLLVAAGDLLYPDPALPDGSLRQQVMAA
ncbi:MAG TPA: hypothetical protein VNL71_05535 [Chloroflexota bacterium]|nr:hypothetical protein [Chloroflexota bacterium]